MGEGGSASSYIVIKFVKFTISDGMDPQKALTAKSLERERKREEIHAHQLNFDTITHTLTHTHTSLHTYREPKLCRLPTDAGMVPWRELYRKYLRERERLILWS